MARLMDVAREAGVSMGAASSVISGRAGTIGTSEETRRRIIEAADRLGYSPNPAAVSLSTGKTQTLGLVVNNPSVFLTHPTGALILVAMCSSAAEHGYRVLLAGFSPETPIDARLMDACVVMGWVDDPRAHELAELAKRIPVVVTYGNIPGAIATNTYAGSGARFEAAAEYLYDLGHRDIVVTAPLFSSRPVSELFQAVAKRRSLEVRLREFEVQWRDRTYPTNEEICQLDPLPTAIVAMDDDHARSLIARLARDGHRVPEDVSVFSGDTHRDGFQSAPPLTGIRGTQVRRHAEIVSRLIEAIEQDEMIQEIKLESTPVERVVRESCAPPRVVR